ncbi:DUF3558 domain-containing protein [Streptomyces sp. NPDC002851]
MQRKGYIVGTAALLGALLTGLTGCTSSPGLGEAPEDSKPGDIAGGEEAPGRYRTLPDACRAVDHSTLDSMLPGLRDLGPDQRDEAYAGTAEVTYDTDRRVGCNWKVVSGSATHHLRVDFERVVSYDGDVSDDARAQEVYDRTLTKADLPDPDENENEGTETPSPEESESSGADGKQDKDATEGSGKATNKATDKGESDEKPQSGGQRPANGDALKNNGDATAEPGADADASASELSSGAPGNPNALDIPAALQPRVLAELGDEAFLNDELAAAGSASRHRTVTVVFRTSNVIVTIEYDEQPDRRAEVPDSKELQDKARALAAALAERFTE